MFAKHEKEDEKAAEKPVLTTPGPEREEHPDTIAKKKMSGKELTKALLAELEGMPPHTPSVPKEWLQKRLHEILER
jgi:hypothetical protein